MQMKGKIGNYLSKIQNESGEFEILQLLEDSMDTQHPEQSDEVPIKLLGFGEISIVFEILSEKTKNLAFKRLPIFDTEEQVEKHIQAYSEYNRILSEVVGINVPKSDAVWVYASTKKKKKRGKSSPKKITLYCIQEKLNPDWVGNHVIHHLSEKETLYLIRHILREMKKVWNHNLKTPPEGLQIALDGQISNWVIQNFSQDTFMDHPPQFSYIDTSTPMYRLDGKDAMEGALFLKSAPSFLQWALKGLLTEVLDRYYDWREVIIDLVANFYKEQLPELIPGIIEEVNTFFQTEAQEFEFTPLTVKEIRTYYKHDKFIWVLFQKMRGFDRFLKTKIFRKEYDFYLPPKIQR